MARKHHKCALLVLFFPTEESALDSWLCKRWGEMHARHAEQWAEPTPTPETPGNCSWELFVKERLGLEASKTREWQCREHCSSRSWWCMEHHSPPVTSEGGGHHLTFNTVVNSQLSWKDPCAKSPAGHRMAGTVSTSLCTCWCNTCMVLWGFALRSPFLPRSFTVFCSAVSVLVPINAAVTSFKTKLQEVSEQTDFLDIPWISLFYFPCSAFDVISPSLPWQFHTYPLARVHTLIKLKEKDKAKHFFL